MDETKNKSAEIRRNMLFLFFDKAKSGTPAARLKRALEHILVQSFPNPFVAHELFFHVGTFYRP